MQQNPPANPAVNRRRTSFEAFLECPETFTTNIHRTEAAIPGGFFVGFSSRSGSSH
ncbi:hypothetical protein [Caballeronia insecticola]|uniref:Uncharacterized protein n=1 Tax=Caballeronia insecticola TaxID=758793 RepID=R4WSY5_9BURK|nr:hypothetical protein [Caballeronia insecticola]BAN22006.1 hypothetical protein BRPE64_ACDS02520 [Caballeronia insecticola]